MARQDPLVSLVTPLYNGEAYLRECVESVLAQTYTNWDCTIVNNCSTDASLQIAQEYAAKDSRIRVRTNASFVPVIENYNTAFRHISPTSRYCKPIAADDMLLPACLEKMVALAEEHPRVVMVGAYGVYSRPEMGVYCSGVPYPTPVLNGAELCRSYLMGKGPAVFGAPTYLLYRADIVRSRAAFFNESNLHADTEACLEFCGENDFGFVHQILTFTRVRDGSLTSLSQRLNTYLPHRLYVLNAYGPRYLDQDELKRCVRDTLDDYYHFLGWQLSKGRDEAFWNYHRERLAAVGFPLNRRRLAAAAASYALDVLLNPKRSVERARDWWRSRQTSSGNGAAMRDRISR